MKLIIEDDEGHKTTVPFVRDEITVGRQEGNTIRLTERNVSRRHARFYRRAGAVWVEDLKSFNGIRINGDRIDGAAELRDGDLVQIGDFDLAVQPDAEKAPPPPHRTEQMPALDLSSAPTASGLSPEDRDPSSPPPQLSRREATSVIRVPLAVPSERPADPTVTDFEAQEVRADQAPRLVITTTELAGREFACVRSVLTVGRGDECDIVINHRSLSRAHCRIFRSGDGAWKVADLGSANRVQVNDEEYAESALHSGDIIGLGHVKLRFVAPGEDFVFGAEARRRSPLPLFLGAGVLAAALGGGIVYYLQSHKSPQTETPVVAVPVTPTPTPIPKPAVVAEPTPKATPPPEPAAPKAATVQPAPHPAPPDEVKVADEEDPQTKRINDAATRAEELLRKKDVRGAQRALAAVKQPGSNVAFDNAQRHVNGEAENLKLVSEFAPPKKVPSGNALDRLRMLATDDRSVFRENAAQIVARVEKAGARTPKRPPTAAEPKLPATPEPKAPVLVATAADDKVKRAYELGKEGNAFMNKGDYEGAVASLSQAVSLDATNADYLYSLASCFAILDKNADAARDYRQFLKLFPNDRRAPLVRESLRSFENTAPPK